MESIDKYYRVYASINLDNIYTNMKELSEEYSDYEHYPNLKGYYTTTSSFFDFFFTFSLVLTF